MAAVGEAMAPQVRRWPRPRRRSRRRGWRRRAWRRCACALLSWMAMGTGCCPQRTLAGGWVGGWGVLRGVEWSGVSGWVGGWGGRLGWVVEAAQAGHNKLPIAVPPLRSFTHGTMTPLFVRRLFAQHCSSGSGGEGGASGGGGGGRMDFAAFSAFGAAWEQRHRPAATRYFFQVGELGACLR